MEERNGVGSASWRMMTPSPPRRIRCARATGNATPRPCTLSLSLRVRSCVACPEPSRPFAPAARPRGPSQPDSPERRLGATSRPPSLDRGTTRRRQATARPLARPVVALRGSRARLPRESDRPQDAGRASDGTHCRACKLTESVQHPDLHWLFPSPTAQRLLRPGPGRHSGGHGRRNRRAVGERRPV